MNERLRVRFRAVSAGQSIAGSHPFRSNGATSVLPFPELAAGTYTLLVTVDPPPGGQRMPSNAVGVHWWFMAEGPAAPGS